MAAPLSIDLRQRVVDAVELESMIRRTAAARFGVGVRTANRWVLAFRERGDVAPLKMGNPSPPILTPHRERGLALLEKDPDISIEGLRHALADQGIIAGYGSIRRFFKRDQITRKKDADGR
jgi:putative transposase